MALITETLQDIELTFETAPGVFSPREIDRGTRAMLSIVEFREDDKVLDLGCGYGVVGILAARLIGAGRVVMIDSSEMAIRLARRNAARNGVAGIRIEHGDALADSQETDFTLILSNPPYHDDFSVAKRFIHKGFNRLVIGGRMYMVTRRRTWYRNKLITIFGGVSVSEIDGYWVLMAEKRRLGYAKAGRRRRVE